MYCTNEIKFKLIIGLKNNTTSWTSAKRLKHSLHAYAIIPNISDWLKYIYIFLQIYHLAFFTGIFNTNERKKESIQIPHLNQKTVSRETDKKVSHTREPGGQPGPAGDHKAARNRQPRMAKTKAKHKQNDPF